VRPANRHHSFFELAVIMLLLAKANWPAITASVAGLLPWLHMVFLLASYLLVRLLVGRLNKWIGKLVFSCTVLLLLGDITVQQFTGLHINPFVASLLFQQGFSAEIGISGPWAITLLLAILGATLAAARLIKKPAFLLKGRTLLILALVSGIGAQALYGLLFYKGVAEVEEVRRKLAFFTAPHAYHREKLFSIFLDSRGENPFAAAGHIEEPRGQTPVDIRAPKTRKNILLIVTDSLRSKDIAADAALAPNLSRWGAEGLLSYDHISTSNCTHFSFYSMFTGKLPTGYGAARRSNQSVGMLKNFAASGYQLSTAESNSLDWYGVAGMIFPSSVKRYIAAEGDRNSKDKSVTAQTIEQVRAAGKAGKPFFHLAYYFGTHYPYGSSYAGRGGGNLENYALTIRRFDNELGQLMAWINDTGLLETTIIIITSDHGEEFAATDTVGHASRLSDEQLKVPFVLVDKGSKQPGLALIQGSHLGIVPYLMGATDNKAPAPDGLEFLANCGYDYPTGFAVLSPDWRADFNYRDGYLTPSPSPGGTLPSADIQSKAAAALVSQMKDEEN